MEQKELTTKELKIIDKERKKNTIAKIKEDTNKKVLLIKENSSLTKTEKEKAIEDLYNLESEEILKVKQKYRSKYPIKYFPIVTISLFIMVVCGSLLNLGYRTIITGYWNDYGDYTHLTSKNMFDSENNGDSYYVYIYSENCSACESIKSEVKDYAERGGYKLYFLCSSDYPEITGDKTDCVGKTKFSECTIQYTPTLLFIENGVCTFCTYGTDSVVDKLNGKI